MRLLFVRHGEPNYINDCLTENGLTQAQLLVPRMKDEEYKVCYCSSMRRAMQTAAPFLKDQGRDAIYCDWLREFQHTELLPDGTRKYIPWDLAPEESIENDEEIDKDLRYLSRIVKSGHLEEFTRQVIEGFDTILSDHGYVHTDGINYHTEKDDTDTLLFVCHFGVMSVILGHLLGVSPMEVWSSTIAPYSSLTQIYTRELEPGKVQFEVDFCGDTAHL